MCGISEPFPNVEAAPPAIPDFVQLRTVPELSRTQGVLPACRPFLVHHLHAKIQQVVAARAETHVQREGLHILPDNTLIAACFLYTVSPSKI